MRASDPVRGKVEPTRIFSGTAGATGVDDFSGVDCLQAVTANNDAAKASGALPHLRCMGDLAPSGELRAAHHRAGRPQVNQNWRPGLWLAGRSPIQWTPRSGA